MTALLQKQLHKTRNASLRRWVTSSGGNRNWALQLAFAELWVWPFARQNLEVYVHPVRRLEEFSLRWFPCTMWFHNHVNTKSHHFFFFKEKQRTRLQGKEIKKPFYCMAVTERKTRIVRRSNRAVSSNLFWRCNPAQTITQLHSLRSSAPVCLEQTPPTRKSRKHRRCVHNASSSAWRWLLPALLFQVNTNSARALSFSRVLWEFPLV